MAMIKSNQAGQMMRDVIVLDLGDLRKQADQIRQSAHDQAQQILAEARQQAGKMTAGAEEIGRRAGYEAGRTEGLEAGRQAGHAEALEQSTQALQQMTEAWTAALRHWDSQRHDMMIEARQSLMRLAVEIAAKIVKRVPRIDPMVVSEQLASAIEQVTRPSALTVRIHPEDRPLIEQALPALVDAAHQVDDAELVDDDRLARGGCVVESGQGKFDATLDGQLQRMVEALLPGQMDRKDLQRIVRVDNETHHEESIDQTIERVRQSEIDPFPETDINDEPDPIAENDSTDPADDETEDEPT